MTSIVPSETKFVLQVGNWNDAVAIHCIHNFRTQLRTVMWMVFIWINWTNKTTFVFLFLKLLSYRCNQVNYRCNHYNLRHYIWLLNSFEFCRATFSPCSGVNIFYCEFSLYLNDKRIICCTCNINIRPIVIILLAAERFAVSNLFLSFTLYYRKQ